MEVRTGVYTFDLVWPDHAEPLSVHVLETGAATVMVGAGHESTTKRVIEIARECDVDVVVAEHGDPDHYGGMPALREELGVETAVPVGDVDRLAAAGIDVDHLLKGGERYWGIETIDAPGHTPGNLAYRYEDVLVAGDTVAGSDSAYVASDDWSGPLGVTLPESAHDDGAMRESVGRLLDYEFSVVLVTHGSNVLDQGRAAVESLVADLAGAHQ